jgi:hypothetical protein
MRKTLLIWLLCGLYIAPALAQSNEEGDQPTSEQNAQAEQNEAKSTLASLAREADFIGIVKVDTVEYETMRTLPIEGFAILRVLVTYRHPGDVLEAPDIIEVHEQGIDEDACYYPERENEGRRYLAFLNERTGKDEDGKKKTGYKGTKPGCMLPVLVTADNRFALRYPVPEVDIRDRSVIQKMNFADPDAFVTAGDDLSFSSVDYMLENDWLNRVDEDRHRFTTGIYLDDARALMELDKNASADGEQDSDG